MTNPATISGGGHGSPTTSMVAHESTWGSRRVRLGCCAILTAAVPVTLVVLANLPTTEAIGGPGTWGLPVCLAACIAATTAASATGPWTGFAVWMACKTACIAGAIAF